MLRALTVTTPACLGCSTRLPLPYPFAMYPTSTCYSFSR